MRARPPAMLVMALWIVLTATSPSPQPSPPQRPRPARGAESPSASERASTGSVEQPEVYLALDPEFAMSEEKVPGEKIGAMAAREVNEAIAFLDEVIAKNRLPPKVLIVHQFTLGMLPDKENIRDSEEVDVVLDMDGFGGRALKRASYRAVMRQRPLEFAGIKLFYLQDEQLFEPADVMKLKPLPSVVIYQ